ncbi:MAG: hypothetical protein QNL88_11205 [Acidobacteriota bacterium]|nr:hypothetical protein [Acidobacteriota bacterium]
MERPTLWIPERAAVPASDGVCSGPRAGWSARKWLLAASIHTCIWRSHRFRDLPLLFEKPLVLKFFVPPH